MRGEDAGVVDLCRNAAGDGRCPGQSALRQHFHRSRCVVESDPFHLRVLVEEAAALGQRHRMGINLAHILASCAGKRDQVVDNAQAHFAHNMQVVGKQQIEILVNGPGQGILNRNQAVIRAPAGDAFEGRGECLTGQHTDPPTQEFIRSFLTKRPSLTLESNQGCCHEFAFLPI